MYVFLASLQMEQCSVNNSPTSKIVYILHSLFPLTLVIDKNQFTTWTCFKCTKIAILWKVCNDSLGVICISLSCESLAKMTSVVHFLKPKLKFEFYSPMTSILYLPRPERYWNDAIIDVQSLFRNCTIS